MKEKITVTQLVFLITLCREILTLIFLPSTFANSPDIWLSALLGPPFLILFALPVYLLWKRYPNETIIQSSQTILGKIGIFIGLIYVLYFFDQTAIALVDLSSFYSTTQMPETPNLFFIITLALSATYAVYKGIEVLNRISEFLFPLFAASLVIFFLFLIPNMNLGNLQPFLENGILPVLQGSLTSSAVTSEILFLGMLLPCLNKPNNAKYALLFSSILICIFALLIVLPVLLVFGAKHTSHVVFPYYDTIRIITIGNFIERIESIHLSFCVLGAFVKVSIYYYLTVLSLSQVLKISDLRPLIIPIGVLIIAYCPMIGSNIVEFVNELLIGNYPWYNAFFIVIIPTALLLLSYFLKKGVSSQ